jgi:aryl-alcohol dehydrogenase-like predicted oxidoreductase
MKITLGSVQFGCDYGVSNQSGQVSNSEIKNILNYATEVGISLIDTAPAYGNSEQNLGAQKASKCFDFVSKIPPDCHVKEIVSCCKKSLADLNCQQLSGLMLHHGEQLLQAEGDEIYHQLLATKNKGLTKKIGCSVYSAKQALEISKKYPIDIVQIPANIFDQEIFQDNILSQLKQQKIEIHIRSLFLQGAIFLTKESLPEYLAPLMPYLAQLTKFTEQYANTNKNTVLIAYALAPFIQKKEIDKLVLGSCSVKELKQIVSAVQLAKKLSFDYKKFAISDPKIINPSLWNQ